MTRVSGRLFIRFPCRIRVRLMRHESALRGTSVSDAVCGGGRETIVLQKVDLTTKKGKGEGENKDFPFPQCLPAGADYVFRYGGSFHAVSEVSSLDEIIDMMRTHERYGFAAAGADVWRQGVSSTVRRGGAADCLLGGGTLEDACPCARAVEGGGARHFIARHLDESLQKRDRAAEAQASA